MQADPDPHRARQQRRELARAARVAGGVERLVRLRTAGRASHLCAAPAPQHQRGAAEHRDRGEGERPERKTGAARTRRRREPRMRLVRRGALDHVDRERLALRRDDRAARRIEVRDLERRDLEPARARRAPARSGTCGGWSRAPRSRRSRAAAARGRPRRRDRRAPRASGRLRVPNVGLAGELDDQRDGLAQAHPVVACRRGARAARRARPAARLRAAARRGSTCRAPAARARGPPSTAAITSFDVRDLEQAGAGREERAPELRSV